MKMLVCAEGLLVPEEPVVLCFMLKAWKPPKQNHMYLSNGTALDRILYSQ